MQIMLKEINRLALDGIESFLAGSQELDFSVESTEAYQFIEGVLSNQRYSKLSRGDMSRGDRGLIRRFLIKVTGLRRAQTTRLIARWQDLSSIILNRSFLDLSRFGPPSSAPQAQPSSDHP